MKLKTVFNQLITYVPIYTDYFTDSLIIESLIYNNNTVVCTTTEAHNLSTGNFVLIRDAKEQLEIISLTSNGNVATATTSSKHDLTEGYQTTINITGADQAEYNGDKTLLSVPNKTSFTFTITSGAITPATGQIYLNQDLAFGYNGYFNIDVIDANSFSYSVERDLSQENGNPILIINPRIYATNNLESTLDVYTKQQTDNYALFIELGAETATRSNTSTDATYPYIRGQEYRQSIYQPINIYIIAPTTETVNAGEIRDSLDDIKFILIKSLCGAFLEDHNIESARQGISYTNSDIEEYRGAYLVLRITFESLYYLTTDDIFKSIDTITTKNININYLNDFDVIIKEDINES